MTFELTGWPAALLLIPFYFVVPAFIVWWEKSDKTLNRMQFNIRWIGVFVVLLVLIMGPIEPMIGGENELVVGIIVFVIFLALYYLQFIWTVRRARDAGMDKKIAYWCIVPLVQNITYLILIFKGSAEDKPATLEA